MSDFLIRDKIYRKMKSMCLADWLIGWPPVLNALGTNVGAGDGVTVVTMIYAALDFAFALGIDTGCISLRSKYRPSPVRPRMTAIPSFFRFGSILLISPESARADFGHFGCFLAVSAVSDGK